MPTFNGKKTLPFTLFNLLKQEYQRENYEIIMVDDGSTDGTVELVNSFIDYFHPKGFNISLLRNIGRGAASARNSGISAAKGKIIVMIDQDVFLPRAWLSEIANSMNSKEVAGIYGEIITDFANFIEPLMTTSIKKKYLTACAAYWKEVLIEVGMFSEEFPFYRGDSELAYKILSRGYKIKYVSSVVVYHPLRRFKWRDLISVFKWSIYDPLILKKHGKLATEDILKQIIPRFTPEGLSFFTFLLSIVTVAILFSAFFALWTGILLILVALISLSIMRSSYKGRPWNVRLKGSLVSLLLYFFNVLGRIIGSIKHKKLII
jgi:glycosyltransferase involved in cell wall biosynthesis